MMVPVEGSVVVFAKCPIPGKSKTRLIPLLGEEGSVGLAKGMLSDVLKSIDGCVELKGVRKILVYAPDTTEGRETMDTILDELGLDTVQNGNNNNCFDSWHLLPMMSKTNDLRSNDLGAKLEDALIRVRNLNESKRQSVVFLGMDAPILPLDDIVSGLQTPNSATLCPAKDGGYAMLCVPHTANPSQTFSDLYWSHPWTGMSQAKAMTDQGIPLRIGTIVRDIDETTDVEELCHHLGIDIPSANEKVEATTDSSTAKNLEFPCGQSPSIVSDGGRFVTSSHPTCHYTRKALVDTFGFNNS